MRLQLCEHFKHMVDMCIKYRHTWYHQNDISISYKCRLKQHRTRIDNTSLIIPMGWPWLTCLILKREYLHAIQATIYDPNDITKNLPHLLVWENKFSCCHSEFQHKNSVNRCFYTCIRHYMYHNTIVYP
jgi:hypothetical protein